MKELNIKWDERGLLPCIVQDSVSSEVLMLAYMNEESLNLTIQTGVAHYFSRSKQRIWKKGEQSGHTQEVCGIKLDCDRDTLLLDVNQIGVACHTGEKSCFFRTIAVLDENKLTLKSTKLEDGEVATQKGLQSQNTKVPNVQPYDVIDILYHTLLERRYADASISYTAALFAKGDNAIAKKIIEEAGEFCFAFKDKDSKEIIYECADVLYHILVALANEDIHPDRIYQELARRMGVSGIVEKQNRAK